MAVIVYGYPFAIIAPAIFIDFIQAPDDYHISMDRFTNRIMEYICLAFILRSQIFIKMIFQAKFQKPSFLRIAIAKLLGNFYSIFLIRKIVDVSFRLPNSAVILLSLIGTINIGETAVTTKLIHPVKMMVEGYNLPKIAKRLSK